MESRPQTKYHWAYSSYLDPHTLNLTLDPSELGFGLPDLGAWPPWGGEWQVAFAVLSLRGRDKDGDRVLSSPNKIASTHKC